MRELLGKVLQKKLLVSRKPVEKPYGTPSATWICT